MPVFDVTVGQVLHRSAVVTIEAESEAAARKEALADAGDLDYATDDSDYEILEVSESIF